MFRQKSCFFPPCDLALHTTSKSHECRRSFSSVDALTVGSLNQSDPRISATKILLTKPHHPKQTGHRCSLFTSRVLPKLVRANTETALSSLDDRFLLADRSILTVSGAQNRQSGQACSVAVLLRPSRFLQFHDCAKKAKAGNEGSGQLAIKRSKLPQSLPLGAVVAASLPHPLPQKTREPGACLCGMS